MAPSAIDPSTSAQGLETQNVLSPPQLYTPREIHFEKYLGNQPDGYRQAVSRGPERAAIVIDNGNTPLLETLKTPTNTKQTGSSATRAGWSFEDAPRINLTPIFSKYRDRKFAKTFSFVGADVYADTTARGHMRNAFEAGSGIVSNWDVMESVLDYVFIKMGIDGSNGGIEMPIVMTEAVANLPYSRKCKFLRDLVVGQG
jgi:actin-related protein 5